MQYMLSMMSEIVTDDYYDNAKLDEDYVTVLMTSMDKHGLLQPILVAPVNGKRLLIIGRNRYQAAKNLKWLSIPVIWVELSAAEITEYRLVQALPRVQSSPDEYKKAIEKLKQRSGWSFERISDSVGLAMDKLMEKMGL